MLRGQQPPFNLLVPVVLLLTFYLVELVDAARVTWRNRCAPARAYDRWWVWAGAVGAFFFVVQPVVGEIFRRSMQGLVCVADSMTPTVLKHDYVMVDRTGSATGAG